MGNLFCLCRFVYTCVCMCTCGYMYVWMHVQEEEILACGFFYGRYLGGRLYSKASSCYSQEVSLAAREFVI